uniref:Archaeal Type IV pilin N-terminal domain-containing protein n=1 Tax=Geoglobus ahangari TaxID=113653 RepID=A0A7C3UKQ1_9EURY
MSKKAFSSIVGIFILTATVIMLSAFIFLAFPLKIPEKPPFVLYSVGKELNSCNGCTDDQVVLLIHKGGDCVDVKRITIHVRVIRDNEVIAWFKLWNFPWRGNYTLKDSGVSYLDDDGDTEKSETNKIIIDTRGPSHQPWLGELAERYGDGFWCMGEQIGFRIKKTGLDLQYGDTVELTLIWDSKSVIIRERIRVLSDVP